MFKSHLALIVLATCAALPLVSKADTIATYNFTYTGVGNYTAGETASGTGSITFDISTLGSNKATVTAFSFTDTLTSPSLGTSVFAYGLADLTSVQDVFGGTLSSPNLTNLQIQTAYLAGSNSNYANTDFNLAWSGPGTGSTADAHTTVLGDFTSGSTTVTAGTITTSSASVVPEPSTYLLFATGIMGAALLYKNRKQLAAGAL